MKISRKHTKVLLLSAMAAGLEISPAAAADSLLSLNHSWDFLHPLDGVSPASTDDDFDSTWMTGEGYDGPAFTKGKPGPYSYGGISYFSANNITGTFIGAGADGNSAPEDGLRYSAYFRTSFTASAAYAETIATLLADDGAVIYIDGEEVARVNMSGSANGTGDYYEMLANDPNGTESAPLITLNLGPVSAGPHILSVSLHNADLSSSDLGFSLELSGRKPVLLRTDFQSLLSEVGEGAAISGWEPLSTGGWQLNAPDAEAHELRSASVDLSAVGKAYFSMELVCHETSGSSNFEETDVLSAKLLAVMDDGGSREISLLPAALDSNGDGQLSGAEFAPGDQPAATAVMFARQLRAEIPADVKSLSLLVSGKNDSGSEFFAIGGALLSDQAPGADADGDGISREAELQAGTDPADPASAFRITESFVELNPDTSNYEYTLVFPAVAGREYGFEQAVPEESGLHWTWLGSLTATSTGDFGVYFNLGPVPNPSMILRARCMP